MASDSADPRVLIEDISIGFFLTAICILGILGNIVTFIVLCYQHQKTRRVIITFFLLGLSFFDTLFLITWLGYGLRYAHRLCGFGLPSPTYSSKISAYYSLIVQPCGYIGVVGSTTFIVAITIDRYLTVCRTRIVKRFCEKEKFVCISVSLIVFLMALPIALPTWLSHEIIPAKNGDGFIIRKMNDNFADFKHWYKSTVTMIVAFPILIVGNALIFKKVHRANKRRKMLTESEASEISLAKMLLCVVLVFGICNTPVIVKAIIASVSNVKFTGPSSTGKLEKHFSQTIFRIVHWLGIVINASVNFLIYCMMSRAFRTALADLCQLLWAKLRGRPNPPQKLAEFRSSTKITACGSLVTRGKVLAGPMLQAI